MFIRNYTDADLSQKQIQDAAKILTSSSLWSWISERLSGDDTVEKTAAQIKEAFSAAAGRRVEVDMQRLQTRGLGLPDGRRLFLEPIGPNSNRYEVYIQATEEIAEGSPRWKIY